MKITYKPEFVLEYKIFKYVDGEYKGLYRTGGFREIPCMLAILKEYDCLPVEQKAEKDNEKTSIEMIKYYLKKSLQDNTISEVDKHLLKSYYNNIVNYKIGLPKDEI